MPTPESEALELTLLDPQDFAELVEACRKFIRVWIEAEDDLTHYLVITFVGIASEADEVRRARGDRRANEAHFYRWHYPYYIDARDEMRRFITS